MKKKLINFVKVGVLTLVLGATLVAYVPVTAANSRFEDPPGGGGIIPQPRPKPPIKIIADPPGGGGIIPQPRPIPPPTK
jgi:hypothetical protein